MPPVVASHPANTFTRYICFVQNLFVCEAIVKFLLSPKVGAFYMTPVPGEINPLYLLSQGTQCRDVLTASLLNRRKYDEETRFLGLSDTGPPTPIWLVANVQVCIFVRSWCRSGWGGAGADPGKMKVDDCLEEGSMCVSSGPTFIHQGQVMVALDDGGFVESGCVRAASPEILLTRAMPLTKGCPWIIATARAPVFRSASHPDVIGHLTPGDTHVASGPPVNIDGFIMLPLRGGGAVESRFLRKATPTTDHMNHKPTKVTRKTQNRPEHGKRHCRLLQRSGMYRRLVLEHGKTVADTPINCDHRPSFRCSGYQPMELYVSEPCVVPNTLLLERCGRKTYSASFTKMEITRQCVSRSFHFANIDHLIGRPRCSRRAVGTNVFKDISLESYMAVLIGMPFLRLICMGAAVNMRRMTRTASSQSFSRWHHKQFGKEGAASLTNEQPESVCKTDEAVSLQFPSPIIDIENESESDSEPPPLEDENEYESEPELLPPIDDEADSESESETENEAETGIDTECDGLPADVVENVLQGHPQTVQLCYSSFHSIIFHVFTRCA
jgi:hypothetical protein